MNLDAIASRLEYQLAQAEKLKDHTQASLIRKRLEGILGVRDQLLVNEMPAREAAAGTHLDALLPPQAPTKTKQPTICVMAECCNAAYAWLRKVGDPPAPYLGDCVAELRWCAEEFRFAKELHAEFEEWSSRFESDCHKPEFNWEGWNAHGISLAKRLKQLAGDSYLVEYHYTYEDPTIRFPQEPPPVLNIE